MAETIELLDISKYQGVLTEEIVAKMVSENVRGVMVRFSQGLSYRDPQAVNNTMLLQAGGIKVGPYHFTTNDNALGQFNNFVAAMGDLQFDLIPAMDCEAYTALGEQVYGRRELMVYPQLKHLSGALDWAENYGWMYPSSAVVDSLGGRGSGKGLTGWMKTQPKLSYAQFPAIYTNASSGNTIFGSNTIFSQYPLWVANWNVALPFLPKAWQGKPYYMWQNAVIDATPYGLDSLKVDHNLWGDQYPFPGETPPPPPPAEDWFDVIATHSSGKVYKGRMEPEA